MTSTSRMAGPELLAATDDEIDDAIGYADPLLLRALLYQLTRELAPLGPWRRADRSAGTTPVDPLEPDGLLTPRCP
jgi:hypothetical protein